MRPTVSIVSICGLAFLTACSSSPSASGPEAFVPADGAAGNSAPGMSPPNQGAPASGADGGGEVGKVATQFPLVSPPVRAATPAGFGGTGVRPGGITTQGLRLDDLALSDIKSRFFMAGPTNIYSLLGSIDDRVSGINTQAQQRSPACLTQPPVAYVIHPFGQSVTLYAQCFQRVGSSNPRDPGFVQFGQKDGVTYYYSAIGAGWTAAVLTPTALASIPDDADAGVGAEAGAGVDAGAGAGVDAGADPDAGSSPEAAAAEAGAGPAAQTYLVRAWSGVGYLNATGCGNMTGFDDCSYGVIQLEANSSSVTFEMSVAGIGFGYCGAQLKSDGTNVYGIGSPDMGTTCGASDTFCVAASDVTTPATCGSAVKTLTLPALGRMSTTGPNAGGPGAAADSGASWAASQYPRGSSDGIVLDGTTSDSLYFGPTGPTAGVGEF